MPKEMNKKRLYMCSLCGKVWENDEVEKGKNEILRLEGYRDNYPYSNCKKECPICHALLFTPEATREVLKKGYMDWDSLDDYIREKGKELRRKWLAKYKNEHKDYYEDFSQEESLE